MNQNLRRMRTAQGGGEAHDTTQIGCVQKRDRNATRVGHDRTIQITVGVWSSDGQKERRPIEVLL